MSDEPKKRQRWRSQSTFRERRIVSRRILLGVGAGIMISLVNAPSWRFWVECISLGALLGLALGIVAWLFPVGR